MLEGKTKDWIAVYQFGRYYNLLDGKLFMKPMNENGSMDDVEPIEVTSVEDEALLLKINKRLGTSFALGDLRVAHEK